MFVVELWSWNEPFCPEYHSNLYSYKFRRALKSIRRLYAVLY
jgi:hypothetical protein